MTRLENPNKAEGIVGAKRHATAHIVRAVSAEERVYILHSEACVASGIDLRECSYSGALDLGIITEKWASSLDRPVIVVISIQGDLLPVGRSQDAATKAAQS